MRLRLDAAAAVLAVAYVLGVVVSMDRLSFDVWGAFVLAPVLMAASYLLLRRVFTGDRAHFVRLAMVGLVAKLAGAVARYWISYNSYLGLADAAGYHTAAAAIAARARAGQVGPLELLPHGLGTRFIEQLAGVVYAVFGSTRLGGAFVFATFAFWGSVFYLLAALTAVRGLRERWYAALVLFSPSIVYWPSSVGKEAWMFFTLSLGSYGTALVLADPARRRRGFAFAVLGFVGAGFVRPHVVAMWVAGALLALCVALAVRLRSRRSRAATDAVETTRRASDALALGGVLAAALVGLLVVASFTLNFLDPLSGDDSNIGLTDRVTRILDETQRRSNEGGSSFATLAIDHPGDWPAAVIGTLLRPYPWQIDDLTTFLPGIETLGLVVLGVWAARRILTVHRQLGANPYLVMVLCATFMFGLAFSSIANLGILTRQRSLVLPFGVLLICLPYQPKRRRPRGVAAPAPVSASVP